MANARRCPVPSLDWQCQSISIAWYSSVNHFQFDSTRLFPHLVLMIMETIYPPMYQTQEVVIVSESWSLSFLLPHCITERFDRSDIRHQLVSSSFGDRGILLRAIWTIARMQAMTWISHLTLQQKRYCVSPVCLHIIPSCQRLRGPIYNLSHLCWIEKKDASRKISFCSTSLPAARKWSFQGWIESPLSSFNERSKWTESWGSFAQAGERQSRKERWRERRLRM